MKTIKKKFNRATILMLLAINWIVMILLSNHFINNQDLFTPILWTLVIGFMMQLGFLSDQLKGVTKSTNNLK